MKSFLIYKCRMCNQQVEEEKEFTDTTVKLGHRAYSILVNTVKDHFSKFSSHLCATKVYGTEPHYGLCDLVGIRFVEPFKTPGTPGSAKATEKIDTGNGLVDDDPHWKE